MLYIDYCLFAIIELWYAYLIHDTNAAASQAEAVTAVRRSKKAPGYNNEVYSSIPVFKDKDSAMAAIPEGAALVLPVNGVINTTKLEHLNATPSDSKDATSHFLAKINESKYASPGGALAPLSKETLSKEGYNVGAFGKDGAIAQKLDYGFSTSPDSSPPTKPSRNKSIASTDKPSRNKS